MNKNELLNNKKEILNIQDIYKDLAAGDPHALKLFEEYDLDLEAIKTALQIIVSNDNLSEKEKADLLSESWRVNFRAKPPTIDEFLTEKYLGYTAKSIYPKVKKVLKEFLSPTTFDTMSGKYVDNKYRNLILYPH